MKYCENDRVFFTILRFLKSNIFFISSPFSRKSSFAGWGTVCSSSAVRWGDFFFFPVCYVCSGAPPRLMFYLRCAGLIKFFMSTSSPDHRPFPYLLKKLHCISKCNFVLDLVKKKPVGLYTINGWLHWLFDSYCVSFLGLNSPFKYVVKC